MSWKLSYGQLCWTGKRHEMTCQECGALSGSYSICGPCGEETARRTKMHIVWTPEMAKDMKGFHE